MSEWKECTISDVSKLKNGKKRPSTEGIFPVYGGNGIMDWVDQYNEENIIIIGRVGAYCGSVYHCNSKCWVSDNAISAKANTENDNLFLFYLLKSMDLNHHHIGGAQPLMTQDIIGKQSFKCPPLPTQRRIAAILSSLDAKIENNNKVNAKLEEIAQNLFKEWFVDFGPFKDGKFVDSELGPIPEGWRVGTLGEIADNITDGVHNSVKDEANTSYYLLSCKNIKGGKLTIDNKERTISEDTFKQLRKRTKLAKGDILLSSVGTIGEVMLLNENPTNYEFQRSVAIVKAKDGISSSEFIYETFVVRNVELRHLAHGAVQQCIFLSDLVNFNVLIPPYSIIETFTNKSKSLFEKISLNYEENQRLATLRDTLLPKLMSGEIEV